MTAISDEMEPTLKRAIDYDNEQFRAGILPALFRSMLALLRDRLPLVEESTRAHYPAFVEFVDSGTERSTPRSR